MGDNDKAPHGNDMKGRWGSLQPSKRLQEENCVRTSRKDSGEEGSCLHPSDLSFRVAVPSLCSMLHALHTANVSMEDQNAEHALSDSMYLEDVVD